jgi:hypothetical protein
MATDNKRSNGNEVVQARGEMKMTTVTLEGAREITADEIELISGGSLASLLSSAGKGAATGGAIGGAVGGGVGAAIGAAIGAIAGAVVDAFS